MGPSAPCRIIAEIGVNHNGDLDMARRAGADCAKFQTFTAKEIVTAAAPKAAYQLRSTSAAESQLDMLKKLELGRGAFHELKAYCEAQSLVFLSTPYGLADVAFLDELGVAGFKVASALLPEPPFCEPWPPRASPLCCPPEWPPWQK